MRQNAPIIFQFPFFSADPRHWGSAPRPPGRGGRGGKGKGREMEMEGKGKEGEGNGRGKFASLPLGDRRPWVGVTMQLR